METLIENQIIDTLLIGKKYKKATSIKLQRQLIAKLCLRARQVFLSEPTLLNVQGDINICGDIHGQFFDLLRIFEYGGYPNKQKYLFLGDYVDRGKYSIQVMCLLLAYKVKYPDQIFLLRGNHESDDINRIYGFYDECKRNYDVKLWKTFVDMFDCMPLAAVVGDKIFCVHGGLGPSILKLADISQIKRPTKIPDQGPVCDLLWSDPDLNIKGYSPNDRGVAYLFGKDIVKKFLDTNKLDLICRAHEVVEDGYEFFANKMLITLFSAPNYCGSFKNSGAFMNVSKDLTCSLKVLKPDINVSS